LAQQAAPTFSGFSLFTHVYRLLRSISTPYDRTGREVLAAGFLEYENPKRNYDELVSRLPKLAVNVKIGPEISVHPDCMPLTRQLAFEIADQQWVDEIGDRRQIRHGPNRDQIFNLNAYKYYLGERADLRFEWFKKHGSRKGSQEANPHIQIRP